MHVLGHSFCEKRRHTKRPRDLHIRKVSFSGSSLSGCSLSSSSSTASAVTAFIPQPLSSSTSPRTLSGQQQYDCQAPRRLHERALLASPSRRHTQQQSVFDDDDSILGDAEDTDGDDEDGDDVDLNQFVMEMPPHATKPDDQPAEEQSDYFFFPVAKRPSLPRSRWSESTIQSVQTIDAIPTPGSTCFSSAATEAQDEQCGPPVVMDMPPNFSYKRAISSPVPVSVSACDKRPPMKKLDSIDEFVKRGGWKRRGIVFHQEEVDASDAMSI